MSDIPDKVVELARELSPGAFDLGVAHGRAEMRAEIVAWLRGGTHDYSAARSFADALEAGAAEGEGKHKMSCLIHKGGSQPTCDCPASDPPTGGRER